MPIRKITVQVAYAMPAAILYQSTEAATVEHYRSFSPLIGVDMAWKKNGLFTRMELKRDRNLSLTYTGIQLTEIRSNELTVGAGYKNSEI